MSTVPPPGVYLTALSTRLRSRICSASGWPSMLAGSACCRPRSTPLAAATPARSAAVRRARSARSTGRVLAAVPSAAVASCRARIRSCSTRRVARSMPAVRRPTATWRASGVSARSRLCACRRSAASGVRSSCAASATKFCWASNAVRTRPNSRFSSCTSGRTSSGKPVSETGDRSSAWRDATCERTRATGCSEPLTTHHTTSIRIGIMTAMGPSVRRARLPAILRRTARSCATCTV